MSVQILTHFWQAMQAAEQFLRAAAPFWREMDEWWGLIKPFFCSYRANLEQLARADINTGAARCAFIGINNRDAGFRVEMQCVETANFNAVAKTQAAIGTTGTSG